MLTEVGAATWPDRRPGVERPDAGQDAETQIEKEKGQFLLKGRKGPGLHECDDIKGVQTRFYKEIEDGRKDQGASRQQIEEQLHGAVLLPGGAPDQDQGEHGKERDIVPDEDKEEIQAHEEAEDAHYQQEIQGKELLDPFLQLPHGQHPGKVHDAGQKQQGQIETVGSVEIVDAQRFHPEDLLHELEAPLGWS